MKNIFDIGAFNGMDGLCLAIINPDAKVYAFEANKYLIKTIKNNKTKLEKIFKIKLDNYFIYNYAVSNRNGYKNFYIAKNPTVSSLYRFSDTLEKHWQGFTEPHCHTVKVLKVKSIRLDDFCKFNKIKSIDYLHCDTQGNDLNVLKGLGRFISLVKSGKLESSISKEKKLYQNNYVLRDMIYFLKKNSFKITKIKGIKSARYNEVDIFYERNKIKLNVNYTTHYFQEIFDKKFSFINYLSYFLIILYFKFLRLKNYIF